MRMNLRLRPIVAFDVYNPQHRRDYARFLETSSWAHCSVRYEIDAVCGELQGAIQRCLLTYYSQQDLVN